MTGFVDNFYITLISNNSLDYYSENTLSCFTNQFNKIYNLNSDWFVGIAEIFYNKFNTNEFKKSLIYVYTDIIKPVQVGFSQVRCLRIFTNPNQNSVQNILFENIYYMPVERNQFENISITLADDIGQKINFENSTKPTMVVLHFIKKVDCVYK